MRQRLILALVAVSLFGLAAFSFLPQLVQAQTAASSTIVGTITDQSNAVIPGATVKITNVATGVSLATTANDSGQYTFPTVTPGTYTLVATKTGFKNFTVQNLVVDISRSYTVNVAMQVGEVSTSVTVEAGAAVQLETTTAQVGGTVNSREMSALPTLNHQATELITIQPSVSPGTETFPTPQPRFSGAIDDQNTYTLDGFDISDNLVGDGTWLPVNVDSVEELDTGVTNPNATFGRSSGGQINMLARHGTNDYHGSVYWYHQNSALNANSWDLNSIGHICGACGARPHLIDNRGGFRFGGPIFKNKTFFFANYELNRFPQTITFNRNIPTASLRSGVLTFKDATGTPIAYNLATSNLCGPAGNAPCDPRGLGISPTVQAFWNLMPANGNSSGNGTDGLNETVLRGAVSAPTTSDFGVFRLDHNFTDKWRFSGSYSYWRDIAGGTQISLLNGNPSDVETIPTRDVTITGQLTTLVTPSVTNTFRYGWSRYWQNFQVLSPAVTAAQFNLPGTSTGLADDPFVAINPAEGLLAAPIDNSSAGARFQDYFERSTQIADAIDWIKGKHTLEFGTDDRHLPMKNDRADKVVNGITSLVSVLDSVNGNGAFLNLPASDSPQPCAGLVVSNCLPANQLSNWNQLYAASLGLIDNTSILAVRDGKLNPLPFGTPLTNDTVENQFYFYGQDVWRITNALTLSYGLAYGWQSPPTDKLGRQTILIDDTTGKPLTAPGYLQSKMTAALQGQIFNPTEGYVPVHTANNTVFNTDWGNVAPRVSVAWNPTFTDGLLGRFLGDRKTVIRGGYSLVYDRESTIETVVIPMLGVGFGQTISTTAGTPAQQCPTCPASNDPAVSDFRIGQDGQIPLPTVPAIANPVVPSTPFGEILSFQDDPNFKVGRANNFDFDVQRELPHNMLLDVGYIGRYGSRLPSSVDINNAPYFFKDTASGQSFAQAFDTVTAALQAGQVPGDQPFFENQLPGFAADPIFGCNDNTISNTKCLATSSPALFTTGLTQSLFQTMDLYRLFEQGLQPYDNLQTVLSELRTYVGTSSYNALIVSLTKKTSGGLTMQANYTLSKSLDQGLVNQNNAGYYLNSFFKNASYGPSLYDRRHLITGDFVYDLPVGGTHRIHLNNGFDRALSGWSWSGIFEAYSGLPNTATESFEAWGVSGIIGGGVPAIPTVPSSRLKNSVHDLGGGNLNVFADPVAVLQDFRNVRLSTDGRDGSANPFYGLGMWNFDMALRKTTQIYEKATMEFSAQFLNVFNNVNFATPSLNLQNGGFGAITSTFIPANRTNSARWIELGLRVSF